MTDVAGSLHPTAHATCAPASCENDVNLPFLAGAVVVRENLLADDALVESFLGARLDGFTAL